MSQGSHQDERDDGRRVEKWNPTMPCASAEVPNHYDQQVHQAVKAWLDDHAKKLAQAERERDEARNALRQVVEGPMAQAMAELREIRSYMHVSVRSDAMTVHFTQPHVDRIDALLAGQPVTMADVSAATKSVLDAIDRAGLVAPPLSDDDRAKLAAATHTVSVLHPVVSMTRVCEAAQEVADAERRYLQNPMGDAPRILGGAFARLHAALADLAKARGMTTARCTTSAPGLVGIIEDAFRQLDKAKKGAG